MGLITISGNYNFVFKSEYKMAAFEQVNLECKTSLGPVNIQLPPLSSTGGFDNLKLYINDVDNMAGTNPITITADPSDAINGAPNFVINENSGSEILLITGPNDWFLANKKNATVENWEKIGTLAYTDLNISPFKTFIGAKPVGKYIERVMYIVTQTFTNPGLFVLPTPSTALTPPVTSINPAGLKLTSGSLMSTVQNQGSTPQDLQLSFIGPPIPTDWTAGAMDVYVVKKDFI